MLYLSSLLIEEKQIETFDELLEVIKQRAKDGEIFFRIDLTSFLQHSRFLFIR